MGKEYYKMPKLNALYTHLFGYAPDESKLHDALMDVVICMRCFYKIRYDVDLCQQNLDPTIAGYIELMSPEGYKCGEGPALLPTQKKALTAIAEEGEEELAVDVAEEIEQQKDAEQYYEELRESAAAAVPSVVPSRRSSRLSATPAVDYAKGLEKRKYTKKRHHKGKHHKKSKGAPKKRKQTKRKH